MTTKAEVHARMRDLQAKMAALTPQPVHPPCEEFLAVSQALDGDLCYECGHREADHDVTPPGTIEP